MTSIILIQMLPHNIFKKVFSFCQENQILIKTGPFHKSGIFTSLSIPLWYYNTGNLPSVALAELSVHEHLFSGFSYSI